MKPNQQIANEVIQGKWGNDEDRKRRLREAGYNYESVQSIVNAIMAGQAIPEEDEEQTKGVKITGTETLKIDIDLAKYNSIEVTFKYGGDE